MMKMIMKKICLIIMVSLMLLYTAACSSASRNGATLPDTTAGSLTGAAAGTAPAALGTGEGKAAALDMGKDDNTRITVASSNPRNRFLETAVKKFCEINPGIVVEIKQYTEMGETYTRKAEDGSMIAVGKKTDPSGEKYTKTLSAEMMAGTGPDVIDTFYIPCAKFADNGFLCDMEKFIEQDAEFDRNCYYGNILDAVKYKGGLFTMPLGFLADTLAGKFGLPSGACTDSLTLDDFFRLAGESLKTHGVDGTYVLNTSEVELFLTLFQGHYNSFVSEESKKCDFTSGEFVSLIKQVKDAADKKLIFREGENPTSYEKWESLYYLMLSNYDSNSLAYYLGSKGENNVYDMPSPDGKSGIGADVFMEYGINSNSKSKGAAWKFIKFLISEEMQTSPEFFLFPLNKEAMTAKIERERKAVPGNALSADSPIFTNISVYPKKNWQVFKIVEEETRKYFEGQRSAEDTAGAIQGRVDMMIKE